MQLQVQVESVQVEGGWVVAKLGSIEWRLHDCSNTVTQRPFNYPLEATGQAGTPQPLIRPGKAQHRGLNAASAGTSMLVAPVVWSEWKWVRK